MYIYIYIYTHINVHLSLLSTEGMIRSRYTNEIHNKSTTYTYIYIYICIYVILLLIIMMVIMMIMMMIMRDNRAVLLLTIPEVSVPRVNMQNGK